MVQNVILIEQTMDAFNTPRYWGGIMRVRAGDLSGEANWHCLHGTDRLCTNARLIANKSEHAFASRLRSAQSFVYSEYPHLDIGSAKLAPISMYP
jgi:hypothetical protein